MLQAKQKPSCERFIEGDDETKSILNNTVWSICFDSLNHGWIGTDGGLDLMLSDQNTHEYKFIPFRNDPKHKSSLAQNNVLKIFCDRNGNLWLTSVQPMLDLLLLPAFHRVNYKFQHILPQVNKSLSTNIRSTNVFTRDSHDNMWLGLVDSGLICFSMSDDSIVHVHEHFRNIPSNSRSLCDNSVWSIYEDKANDIWIGN
jgi:ligand-binding sensor domain-containing protein